MANPIYQARFSPPPPSMTYDARSSVWSPFSSDGSHLGHQQPPPYGYPNSQSGYSAPASAFYDPQTARTHALNQAFQGRPTSYHSLGGGWPMPTARPGITGQGLPPPNATPYAPVMAPRRPSVDHSQQYGASAVPPPLLPPPHHSNHGQYYPPTSNSLPPVSHSHGYPQSFARTQPVFDPPPHPPPGFANYVHQHPPPQPPPPYRPFEHGKYGSVFQPAEEWSVPSQPYVPQRPGLNGMAQQPQQQYHHHHHPQQQQQQQQQTWTATADWNPWADGTQVAAEPAKVALPAPKGVPASFGAVGEKRGAAKRMDVDVKDPTVFNVKSGKEAVEPMDLDQMLNTIVYADRDDPAYAHALRVAHQGTPPPPAEPAAPVEYQLVPPSNPVPPPPPIEKSAVPLAALGAHLVWDLCTKPRNADGSSSCLSSSSSLGLSSSRRLSGMTDMSDFSPLSSEGVRTPANAWGGRNFAMPVDDDFSLPPSLSVRNPDGAADAKVDPTWPWNPSPVEAPVEPQEQPVTPEFEAFVESILTQTLLTPQVLLLALWYVAKVVADSPMPPPENSPLADPKRAPYKMLLAGLMIANKVLDDNSYRSETFAQVSRFELSELNSLEVFLLGALDWDLTVSRPAWHSWMASIAECHRGCSPRGKDGRAASDMLKTLVEQAAKEEGCAATSPSLPEQRSPPQSGLSAFDMPSTYHMSPQDYAAVDFEDAMGPVKSPFAFQPQRAPAWQGSHSGAPYAS